jgi:hypothetical protein
VDCCYSFRGYYFDFPETDLCECTSNPTVGGEPASCAAAAADHKSGKVIALCPGYERPEVIPPPQ